MHALRSLAVGAACAAFVTPLGTPLAAQEGRFGERVSVVQVEVPVQVVRDGEPVRGLTREDFEILEGRKPREIVGFEVVDLSLATEAPTALPVAARRHFLLLFDLSFSDAGSIVKAREAALEVVRTALHPSDLVGVATVSAAEGARLPLGFTSDRRQVEVAIETLGLPQLVDSVRDPIGLTLTEPNAFRDVAPGAEAGGGAGRGGVDAGAELAELVQSMETGTRRAVDRNRILNLAAQLASLAAVLRDVEGRKHVLYLSEGFDSSVILGTGRGVTAEEQAAIREQAEAAATGEVWRVDSNARFGDTSSQNQLELMLAEFVKAGATIQAIDIGGLAGTTDVRREASGEDGLFVMAEETGGEFLRNFNNLSLALGEVLERTSVTYLLAFQPEDLAPDGSFHEIKVRLKDGGRGVRVVHRPGYYAPVAFAEQNPAARRLATAERILGGVEGGEVATWVLAAAFPMTRGTAHVPVLVEVDGPSLLAGHRGESVQAEILAYAIATDGTVADFFAQPVGLDLAKVGEGLRRTGFKFMGDLELPPGDYSLRVLVRNAETGAEGLRVAQVAVPAADEGLLLPPLVPEPPTRWVLGRAPSDHPYPYLLGEEMVVPSARPILVAGAPTRLLLAGYRLGGATIAGSAELRAWDGSRVGAADLVLGPRQPAEGDFERVMGSLTVPAVEAGSYELVVTVRDEATGATRTSSLAVEVGS